MVVAVPLLNVALTDRSCLLNTLGCFYHSLPGVSSAPHKLHMRHTGQTLHMAWVLLPDHTKRPALGCHSYRTSSTEADRPTPTFILSLSMQPHTYTWVHAVMTHRPMKVFPVFVSHFKEADGSYSGGDGKRSKIFKQKFF
uniref:Secreted protein n=1 Tax=Knipowitschia caucasica TaxID=637954 RepID=A0AAV2KVY6_KNICA